MTSIAGFLASLAGGATQEGQKATQANATGTIGLFSALISATGQTETVEGETAGENTGKTNPLGLTLALPNPQGSPNAQSRQDTADATADADAALGEALGEGLSLPSGEVEAAIIDAPVDGNGEAATGVTPETSEAPSATPDGEVTTTAADDGEDAGPVIPSPDSAIATDNPAPPPATAEETEEGAPAAPAPGNPAANAQAAQAATSKSERQTGLENAWERASHNGRENGLINALNQAPQARSADDAPQSVRPEARPDAPRPSSADAAHELVATKPRQGRPEFAALEAKPVQRLVEAGNGQTQIRIHSPSGGETTAVTSPPTLTVNVSASAASPGPVSPNTPHVPVSALAVHIAEQARNGVRRFDIRLDPPELGRVEVRLDMTREGHVTTHLVVERAETLDLLQRDARHLERMLQDAGLNTSEDGMKFSLKDQGQAKGGEDNQGDHNEDGVSAGDGEDNNPSLVPDSAMPPPSRYLASTGVDIRI